jgi:lipoprotein-anchoring transpeptidase ErfK/SrfK
MATARHQIADRIPRAVAGAAVLLIVAVTAIVGVSRAAADRLVSSGATTAHKPVLAPPPPSAPQKLALRVRPGTGAKRLPVSTEIGLAIRGGRVTRVDLRRAGGGAVAGALRPDRTSWVPSRPLAFSTRYTATVTARSADGSRTVTERTSFTTMGRPGRLTGTGLYLFDGQTYGVGMPVVVEFSPPVPASARAGVQRRLFVTSDPPQPGAWHWSGGSQAFFRPPAYWQPGTTITVRAALRGHPTGGGHHGDQDRSATVRIGRSVIMDVDNTTKRMRVYRDGRLARTVPVSLGKPSTPSSSGTMVVMGKHYSTVFDTRREDGPDGYRVRVNYAMRLTWGGEFIHAAPWSVGDQGRRNVSHGCVNMSWNNASWLFSHAHVGDPVVVRGTEVKLRNGNGWTAWNLPWHLYVKGSALPVPPLSGSAGTPAPRAL